jgi:type I restriction enzyme, S subunit
MTEDPSIVTPYGFIAKHLSVSKLANLCIAKGGIQTGPFGSQLHQKDYVIVGTPIITVEHLNENRIRHKDVPRVSKEDKQRLARFALREGDIVFSRVGSVDRRALVRKEEDGWLFSGRCLRIRPQPGKIDPTFLSYFFGLSGFKAYVRKIAVGATMPSLNTHILSELPIYYPPLPEQQTIAHILCILDDKIELNRQMNKTLEAMANAIFKSWFVDFDPVKAKAEGRKPEGMDDATAALFPSNFTESSLGLIPEGWEVTTVEEIAEQVAMGPFGSSIKVSTFVSEGIPVISGQHLKEVMLTDNEFNFVTEEHAEKLKKANVKQGDVIFTHAGNIGQVSYIPEGSKFERYVLSQRQFYLRCNEQKMSPLFMVYFFRSPEGQHRLLANTSQTGVPSIARPVSYLRTIAFTKPHRKILANTKELNYLSEFRDLLLPRLISGELRVGEIKVKDAEKYAEALL